MGIRHYGSKARCVNNEQRQWVFKQYWITENAEFFMEIIVWFSPTNTIYVQFIVYIGLVKDEYDATGSIAGVLKFGCSRMSVAERNQVRVTMTSVSYTHLDVYERQVL